MNKLLLLVSFLWVSATALAEETSLSASAFNLEASSFNPSSALLTVPKVVVGSDLYLNAKFLHTGNNQFAFQSCESVLPLSSPSTPPPNVTPTIIANLKPESAVLNIPEVNVGSNSYYNLKLKDQGSNNFELQAYDGSPLSSLLGGALAVQPKANCWYCFVFGGTWYCILVPC